jgi:hypothetical protein
MSAKVTGQMSPTAAGSISAPAESPSIAPEQVGAVHSVMQVALNRGKEVAVKALVDNLEAKSCEFLTNIEGASVEKSIQLYMEFMKARFDTNLALLSLTGQ